MGFISRLRVVLGLTFIGTFAWAAGSKWPSAIKRCAMNDPNLDKCVLKQTELAIAKMSKGMPAIGLRSLDPLRNVSFDVGSGNNGPVIVHVHTSNVAITGPSKVQLKKVRFDKVTSTYFIEGYHNLIKLAGDYKLAGNILLIPLDSSGNFEFELRGAFANHSVKIGSNVRSGGHGQVRFDLQKAKSMRFTFHDRLLGEQGSAALTNLVNENMDAVSSALWTPMEKVVQRLYGEALKPLTSKFNVKDFFPMMSAGRSEADEIISDDTTTITKEPPHGESHSYYVQY